MSEKHEPKFKMDRSVFVCFATPMAHIPGRGLSCKLGPKPNWVSDPPSELVFITTCCLEEPLTEADLPDIEKRMRKIIQEKQEFKREDLPKEQALKKLEGMGQGLKAEYAKELLESNSSLSFYTSGPFVDMCEGPHVPDTSKIPVMSFKLDSIAGSYWRGDSKRPMLTRIYGHGSSPTENELKKHLEPGNWP